jgi:hypothetical protein
MLSVFEAQRPSSQYQRGVLVDLVHPLQSHLDVRSRLTNQDGSIERLDSRLLPQRDFISASGHQDVIPGRATQIFDSVCRLCRPMIRYSKILRQRSDKFARALYVDSTRLRGGSLSQQPAPQVLPASPQSRDRQRAKKLPTTSFRGLLVRQHCASPVRQFKMATRLTHEPATQVSYIAQTRWPIRLCIILLLLHNEGFNNRI